MRTFIVALEWFPLHHGFILISRIPFSIEIPVGSQPLVLIVIIVVVVGFLGESIVPFTSSVVIIVSLLKIPLGRSLIVCGRRTLFFSVAKSGLRISHEFNFEAISVNSFPLVLRFIARFLLTSKLTLLYHWHISKEA
jgi:hypothetical protein